MMMLKNVGFFLLATLLVLNFPTATAYERTEDVQGASDSALFERYPRTKIDEFSVVEANDYLLALDSPKTVNGVMDIEYSERLGGQLTRITYRAPDGEDSKKIFGHFRSQLTSLSHELLFECHGRECGSSNQWANRIFGIAKLYGPQRYQHYLAAQINTDNGPVFMVLYSIKRGNKRVYTQLDLLTPDGSSAKSLDVNPRTIINELKYTGVYDLRNLSFDDNDEVTVVAEQRLKPVANALSKNTRLECYVVGHLTDEQPLTDLKKRSLARAESVIKTLVKLGVNADQLNAQGVGPLAPIRRGTENLNRISLVLQ